MNLDLFGFAVKPKILFYADSPTTQHIANQYKKYLPEFEIDIVGDDWQGVLSANNYDILCHSNLALLIWKVQNLESFIKEQHKLGTKVVLFDRNQILTSIEIYKLFDGVFTNDVYANDDLRNGGVPGSFIPDGVDLASFGPDIPFKDRPFRIACRKSDFFWQEMLQKHPDFEFIELFDKHYDADYLNETYNSCQVFYGSIGFMSAAACGVIPVMRDKIGLAKWKNILVCDNDETVMEKILLIKDGEDSHLISQRISKEMLIWDYRFLSHEWGKSIQQIMLKKKAFSLI